LGEIIYNTPERRSKTTEAQRGWPKGNNTSSETSHALCISLRATQKCLWTFESALNCSKTSPHRYHGHYTFVPPQHSSPVNTHILASVPTALRRIESSDRTTTPRHPPPLPTNSIISQSAVKACPSPWPAVTAHVSFNLEKYNALIRPHYKDYPRRFRHDLLTSLNEKNARVDCDRRMYVWREIL